MRPSIAINPAMPVTMETPQRESLLVVMVTMQRTLRVLHCVLRKVRWEGIGQNVLYYFRQQFRSDLKYALVSKPQKISFSLKPSS